MPRTARPVLLNLDLGPQDGRGAASRVATAIVRRIEDGTLTDGDPLPSSRSLATETGMPRSAVVAAYEELIAAGYLAAIGGSGTSVAAGAAAAARAGVSTHVTASLDDAEPGPNEATREIPFDLRPGLADPSIIEPAEWRRAWRVAANEPVSPDLPWFADQGRARRAVATYLRTARGVRAPADAVSIVPGTSAAFRAVVAAFGPARILVENPVYRAAADAFEEFPIPLEGIDVDTDGMRIADLPEERCLVYVTPSHQFPLGHRLSVDRRAGLVEWARRTGSLVVEDDYDGEFRYDVAPLPALQSVGQGPDVVAYVGTASKILSSSLQMAWLVTPAGLRDGVRQALAQNRQGVPPMVTTAVTELIESGSLARTVTRAARVYRARRTALLEALYDRMPWCRVVGLEAGLHLVLMLPPFADDLALVEQLAEQGLHCRALSPYYLTGPRPGLVLGYTRLPEERALAAASVIEQTLARVDRG